MTKDEINEIQTYLQMYDKRLISTRTVLEKIGIDPEEEKKRIKKELEEMQEQLQMQATPSLGMLGGAGSGPSVGSSIVSSESSGQPY